jgi:DNA helicase-2/ATP-dependent DNA helicase PcrA
MTNTAIEQRKIVPNSKQMECIKTLDGSVMVLAGPGTGKTFTIIQRIKYMLEQNILPETMLCLAFSDAAANEMKIRLVKEMGTIASAVTIHTYHAFCNEIIQQYPHKFELLAGVGLIDDISKRNLMKETIDEYNPVFYRTKWGDAHYYINDLIDATDEIKKNQVTKEKYFEVLTNSPDWQGKLDELLADKIEQEEKEKKGTRNRLKTVLNNIESHQRKMGKAKEAWEIYEIYDRKLKENNFIDFNDMINLVLEAFDKDEDFLKQVSKKYIYFLVDEYQDTNYSQNQIVFKLAEGSKNENIFVVGDDDQIIYGFQGAQTDNLEKFLKKYPKTNVICLNENNRSTQTVLDLSYEVISRDKTRLENNEDFSEYHILKKLTAKNPDIICNDRKTKLYGFTDPSQENNYIVEEIENIISADSMPVNEEGEKDLSQIAILTRWNKEIEHFAELLKSKNIPFQIKSSKSIFELKPSILTYFYIKTLENQELFADKLFGMLLSKPFEFEAEDYNFLLEQNRLNHKDFIFNISSNIGREWKNSEKVNSFITVFNELKELKAHEPLKNLIVEIINRTEILEYYVNSEINKVENISSLKRIIDEASSYANLHKSATLQEFINHLDTAFHDDISICIDKDDYIQNAVQLLTLHGAKGREFEYVFIPNLVSKNWEKRRESNSADLPIEKTTFAGDPDIAKKAEQLRLLFVGITRAKHSLFLSYSNSQNNKPLELTEYLASIAGRNDILETKNFELKQDDLSLEIVKSLRKSAFNNKESFKDELKARIKEFTLSPSTLNSYLNCPRNFLYSSLLQIPVKDKENEKAAYGSAVHKTLEAASTQAIETGNYPDQSAFIEMFNKKLSAQKFETLTKRKEYEDRGTKSLKSYYPILTAIPPERINGLEVKLGYVPVEDYFIKGFIDRIEKNNDGTFSLYDYKTGSAKSKSQIADGKDYEHYLNQLRFYKFAFETLHAGEKVSQVGLIYVEEPDNNFYTELCEEDNSVIKEKILNSYRQIHDLNFAPAEQSEKTCGYCGYPQLCRLDIL